MARIPKYIFSNHKTIEYNTEGIPPDDESSFLLYYSVEKKMVSDEGKVESTQSITYRDFREIIKNEAEASEMGLENGRPEFGLLEFQDNAVISSSLIRGIFECVRTCTKISDHRIVHSHRRLHNKYKRCVNFWCRFPGHDEDSRFKFILKVDTKESPPLRSISIAYQHKKVDFENGRMLEHPHYPINKDDCSDEQIVFDVNGHLQLGDINSKYKLIATAPMKYYERGQPECLAESLMHYGSLKLEIRDNLEFKIFSFFNEFVETYLDACSNAKPNGRNGGITAKPVWLFSSLGQCAYDGSYITPSPGLTFFADVGTRQLDYLDHLKRTILDHL